MTYVSGGTLNLILTHSHKKPATPSVYRRSLFDEARVLWAPDQASAPQPVVTFPTSLALHVLLQNTFSCQRLLLSGKK